MSVMSDNRKIAESIIDNCDRIEPGYLDIADLTNAIEAALDEAYATEGKKERSETCNHSKAIKLWLVALARPGAMQLVGMKVGLAHGGFQPFHKFLLFLIS